MKITWKIFALTIFGSLALGLIFALLGVYNTNEVPFGWRFFHWSSTMVVGNCSILIIGPWVLKKSLAKSHPALQIFIVAALISVPVTLTLAALHGGFSPLWHLASWFYNYLSVIVISLILVTIEYFVLKSFGIIGSHKDMAAQETVSPIHKFLDRLPITYRAATLYAVSSEDHYLRIHTDRGEELILMRLSDALRELEAANGLQTHRSWWVAQEGVADVMRSNGKMSLQLKSGAIAPVSRSFSAATKDMFEPTKPSA